MIVAEKLCEMTWHFLMGERTAAQRNLADADPLMWAIPGLLPNYDYFYYGSMSLLDGVDGSRSPQSGPALQRVRAHLDQLRIWVDHNPGKRLGNQIDRTAHGYLDVMKRSTRNMDQLITKLLSLARTNRGSLKLVSVDLGDLLDEVIESLRAEWAPRRIEWRVGSLPMVIGDRELLRPVITNLLSNALKYTRPRELAVIEIGSGPADAEGRATVFVRDNGVGFNPEFVGKLFQEFQRLHDPSDFEGTGIGLASVRRIIERHGGKTWAVGVPDGGATFDFSLPDAPAGREARQEMSA